MRAPLGKYHYIGLLTNYNTMVDCNRFDLIRMWRWKLGYLNNSLTFLLKSGSHHGAFNNFPPKGLADIMCTALLNHDQFDTGKE